MKIKIYAEELQMALSKVQKALTSSRGIQTYQNTILIQSVESEDLENNKILLTAFDGTIRIETIASAAIIESGKILVGSNLFLPLVSKMSGEILIEETRSNEIIIKGKNVNSKIKKMDPKIFPEMSYKNEKEISFSIIQKELKKAIKECLVSVAKEEVRPVLKGILIRNMGKGIANIVSCDGFRLSRYETRINNIDQEFEIIVPAQSMKTINSFINDSEENIVFNILNNQLIIKTKEVTIVTNLIKSTYIKYEKFIPTVYTQQIIVSNKELRSALDFAYTVSSLNKNDMIEVTFQNEKMLIRAQHETADCDTEIPLKKTEGQNNDFTFNIKCSYMEEVSRTLNEDNIIIEASQKTAPIIIKQKDSLFMILPLRTN